MFKNVRCEVYTISNLLYEILPLQVKNLLIVSRTLHRGWNSADVNTSCARAWQRKHIAEDSEFQNFLASQLLATPFTKDVSTNVNSPHRGRMVEQCTHKHILCKGVAKKTYGCNFQNVSQIQNFRHQATCLVFSHTLHRGGGEGW